MGRGRQQLITFFVVAGLLLAASGTASATEYDERTIQKAEDEILKTGDYMLKTTQMVGALEHYNLSANYEGRSIFESYRELELNYSALAWKFLDFKLYSEYPPDEAYRLAKEMKKESEEIKHVAEDALHAAGYSKGTIHEEKVLVMGGLWLSKFKTAFIAAFEGYSPTVAENTDLRAEYEPSGYDVIILNDYVGANGMTPSSYKNLKRLERVLGSDEVGLIFMTGAIAADAYNSGTGVFSQLFPGTLSGAIYDFSYNCTLRKNESAPSEFEGLDTLWNMDIWGAWTFELSPELENQKVILNYEWPKYSEPWKAPVYGRPVAIAFTYEETKIIASGIDSYLVKPWELPYIRPPSDWLSESPGYEEFLTASLEHVAPSKGNRD